MIDITKDTKFPFYGMVGEDYIFGVSGKHLGSEGIAPDFSISNYVGLCIEYDCYAIENSTKHKESRKISKSRFYLLKNKIELEHSVKIDTRFKRMNL